MRLRGILAIIFVGAAVLVALGVWQIQRLNEKTQLLADIEQRTALPPVSLPAHIVPQRDSLLPVTLAGHFGEGYVRVLVSLKIYGAGYRIIAPFQTDAGRLVMVDRGFISVQDDIPPLPQAHISITGVLYWPEEVDSFTPADDISKNIWFARDVDKLAQHFGAEAALVIASTQTPPDNAITPLPQDGTNIPNNHLEYVVTWFGLAFIWLAMGVYFLYRQRRV